MKLPNKSRQRGSVLILAILVVAMVSIFATKASRHYQLSMARAEARWHGAQARSYLTGAESLAIYFLKQDEDTEIDSRLEPWAQPLPPFPIEGGVIKAEIDDAQAKINLNDLPGKLDDDQNNTSPTNPERFSAPQKHFIRLLQSFPEQYPVALEEAVAIMEAIVDWTDGNDQITGFNGAERDYYQSLDPAYRPANRPFTSVEELRLVRGIDAPLMQLLRPYLTVLPDGVGSTLNVNTMHPHLLRTFNAASILAPLNEEDARQILAEVTEAYSGDSPIDENPAWDSVIAAEGGVDADYAGYNTDAFRVTTRVQLGDQRRSMQSLLQRDGDTLKVIDRRDVYDYILAMREAPESDLQFQTPGSSTEGQTQNR